MPTTYEELEMTQKRIDRLEDELDAVIRRNSDLTRRVESLSTTLDEVLERITELEDDDAGDAGLEALFDSASNEDEPEVDTLPKGGDARERAKKSVSESRESDDPFVAAVRRRREADSE